MKHVLLSDENERTSSLLAASLSALGYGVDIANSRKRIFELVDACEPNVVVLNCAWLHSDGLDLIEELHQRTRAGIIVVSGSIPGADRIKLLDAGADDVVTNPVEIDELSARIRALIRRSTASTSRDQVAVPDFAIDLPGKRITSIDGHEIRLSPKEWEIVSVLVRQPGVLCDYRELLRRVWGDQHEQKNHYLRVHMRQIRKKLEPNPSSPRYFITYPGRGYRFQV